MAFHAQGFDFLDDFFFCFSAVIAGLDGGVRAVVEEISLICDAADRGKEVLAAHLGGRKVNEGRTGGWRISSSW